MLGWEAGEAAGRWGKDWEEGREGSGRRGGLPASRGRIQLLGKACKGSVPPAWLLQGVGHATYGL